MAAMACAPPTRKTCVIPTNWAAYKMAGWLEGVQRTTSRQPASWAGTPSINTVLKSGAVPPGTYSPTFSMATDLRQQVTPAMVLIFFGGCFWYSWKTRMFWYACWMATLSSSDSCDSAASMAVWGIFRSWSSILSNCKASSRRAASPFSFTFFRIGATTFSILAESCMGRANSWGHWARLG